jgi:hypothetical protein
MNKNKPENIQNYYRKLYLQKIATFETDYDIILNKYLNKIRKIVFDHSDKHGKLKSTSKSTIKNSSKLLNNWLRIETEDILGKYILETIKIAITGQLKALHWYNKHIIKSTESSNFHKIKNEYDKEKALEIKDNIWKRKWEDGLKIAQRLDKLADENKRFTVNIINKTISRDDAVIHLFHEIANRIQNPSGLSYRNRVIRLTQTETQSAYRLTQRDIGRDSNNVEGIKWNLSPRHPHYDYYEICERYAKEDHDGLGNGVYKPGNLPDIPHPGCFCFLTYLYKNL